MIVNVLNVNCTKSIEYCVYIVLSTNKVWEGNFVDGLVVFWFGNVV